MSTANFITKDELETYSYKRMDDTIVPQKKEKPQILTLLWLKTIFMILLGGVIVLLLLVSKKEFDIDAVKFTKDLWDK
jgi:hypothetical protein